MRDKSSGTYVVNPSRSESPKALHMRPKSLRTLALCACRWQPQLPISCRFFFDFSLRSAVRRAQVPFETTGAHQGKGLLADPFSYSRAASGRSEIASWKHQVETDRKSVSTTRSVPAMFSLLSRHFGGTAYFAAAPASTLSCVPVTYRPLSVTRYSTASVMSSRSTQGTGIALMPLNAVNTSSGA